MKTINSEDLYVLQTKRKEKENKTFGIIIKNNPSYTLDRAFGFSVE